MYEFNTKKKKTEAPKEQPVVVQPVVPKIHPEAVKVPVKKPSIGMDDELDYESLM